MITTKQINNNKGKYISFVAIISKNPGAFIFSLIIFSIPLPMEQIKNKDGINPIIVAKKKFEIFTLNMHGKTLDIAKGIPPINL